MRKSFLDWHMLAQRLSFLCLVACSGQAGELSSDGAAAPENAGDERDGDGAREIADDDASEEARLPATPTLLRVINRSSQVRSRYTPCAGTYTIRVRPASVDEPQSSPTCSPVECAELAPSDIVVPEPACNLAACADARVDLEPGSADIDVAWDGVFWSLTERGCYEPETFEGGAPMLARVCFGAPGADLLEVSGFRCEDVPFAYGTSLVELALE